MKNYKDHLVNARLRHDNPLENELLLAHILGKTREYILTYAENELIAKEQKDFDFYLEKLIEGYPLAYITNEKEFYGRKFFVDEHVLIPRPETEEIVDFVLSYFRTFALSNKQTNENTKTRILDLGTGSGCIAITLALELSYLPPATRYQLFVSDISPEALEVAQKNAATLGANVEFRCGDLLEPWEDEEIDVLVANLPYVEEPSIPKKEFSINDQQSSDLKYEPFQALYAGEDGLDMYRKLLLQLTERKQLPQCFIFEAGAGNTSILSEICKSLFPKIHWEIKKDLGGKERFVVGENRI